MGQEPPWGELSKRTQLDQRVLLFLFVFCLMIAFAVIFVWQRPTTVAKESQDQNELHRNKT